MCLEFSEQLVSFKNAKKSVFHILVFSLYDF